MARAPRLSTTTAAYFETICSSLDSEDGMRAYCRDTFKDGIVPTYDKDAKDLIVLDLKEQYLFEAKARLETWGIVHMPNDLVVDTYADRILAKVRRLNTRKRTRKSSVRSGVQHDESAEAWEDKYLGMVLKNRVLRDQLQVAHARILQLEEAQHK